MSRPAVLLLAAASALLLSGCGGGSSAAAAGGTGSAGAGATAAPSAGCPSPPASTLSWPTGVPADLPVPPGSTLTSTTAGDGGLTIVRFSTEDSLRAGVLSLVRTLQPAGYTLGRGDAEAAEADAPFSRGDLRGVYRSISRQACRTDWLLAVTNAPAGAGAPLLPPPPGGTPASPLPFG